MLSVFRFLLPIVGLLLVTGCATHPTPSPHSHGDLAHGDMPHGEHPHLANPHEAPHKVAAPLPGDDAEPAPTGNGSALSPYRNLDELAEGELIHVPTGRNVDVEQMMAVAADSRVVYVGEMHTNLEDHEAQLKVIRAMHRRHPGRLMIGMEMFAHDAQPTLDQWVAGTLSKEAFLRLWYRHWSEDYDYYGPILEFARDNHIPIIALNATREEKRKVSTGETVPPKRDEEWDDPYHQAYMAAIFGGHAHGGDRYYRVQVLWDDTMARRIATALTEHPDKHMVVLAGGGHIQYGFGIPRRLFAKLPVSYTTIVPITVSMPADRDDLVMDVEVPELPLPYADFVWALPYRDLADQKIRLGVMLDVSGDRLRVTAVMPGSAAERAGVMVDDRLLSLDGHDVPEMADLKAALAQAKVGENGTLVVARNGERVALSVAYRRAGENHGNGNAENDHRHDR